MRITPHDFMELLQKADVVTVDESPFLHSWNTSPITGEDENEVAFFSWTDGEEVYSYKLTEGAIKNGEWVADLLCVSDLEEFDTKIRLYTIQRLGFN